MSLSGQILHGIIMKVRISCTSSLSLLAFHPLPPPPAGYNVTNYISPTILLQKFQECIQYHGSLVFLTWLL